MAKGLWYAPRPFADFLSQNANAANLCPPRRRPPDRRPLLCCQDQYAPVEEITRTARLENSTCFIGFEISGLGDFWVRWLKVLRLTATGSKPSQRAQTARWGTRQGARARWERGSRKDGGPGTSDPRAVWEWVGAAGGKCRETCQRRLTSIRERCNVYLSFSKGDLLCSVQARIRRCAGLHVRAG